MSKTLAIVNSPLQVMMAVEYIKENNIQEIDFAVSIYSVAFLKQNRAVLRYLNDLGYKYKIYITKNLINTLRFINSPKEYTSFLIGDYRSLDKKMLMLFHAKGKVQIVYVDDGSASLLIGKDQKDKLTLRFLFSRLVDNLVNKKIAERLFYSAFIKEKEVLGIPVIRNNMNTLHTEKKKVGDSVVIVGCFCRAFRDYGQDYFVYLGELNHYIHNKWPNSKVYYYPHRREDNIKDITEICENYKWQICYSRINIEIDITQKESLPCEIIGFGSSALYLLKLLFKNEIVTTIHFNESADYLQIEKDYREVGINVYDFFKSNNNI